LCTLGLPFHRIHGAHGPGLGEYLTLAGAKTAVLLLRLWLNPLVAATPGQALNTSPFRALLPRQCTISERKDVKLQ